MKNKLRSLTGERVKIAVIDSGITSGHPLLKKCKISQESLAIHLDNDQIIIDKEIEDQMGHGTAICGIFSKLIPDAELVIIKIFDSIGPQPENPCLTFALNYILDHVKCDIVHMSLGTVLSSPDLEDVCQKLSEKGILLVSAYENSGTISYPANYPNVIGVDGDKGCTKVDDFILIEGKSITVLAKGGNHRLAWKDPPYVIGSGSSFSAAYVTSYIAKMLSMGIKREDIVETFKSICKNNIKLPVQNKPNLTTIPFQIKNAAIFPYNKEMHSLVNYAELLPFNICAIYDHKYTGRVNTKAKSINGKTEYLIQSFDDICWENINTLILGHLNELEQLLGYKIKRDILDMCQRKGVNVYCFDYLDIDEMPDKLSLYIPAIQNFEYLRENNGKMYEFSKPVLGVWGTSPKQGKFTLQLGLRAQFQKLGYSVAQIGSEPSALLFGLEGCFPFGLNSTIKLTAAQSILAANALLHDIDTKYENADLLIVGSQSGSVPNLYTNIGYMTLPQISFLMGTAPDAIILCVNADDEYEIVERSIKAIEGAGDAKVIAIAIYPFAFKNEWKKMNNKREKVEDISKMKEEIHSTFKLPAFIIGETTDIVDLCEVVIDFLSDDK